MANDKHSVGYSEALGGYGVPVQVKATGGGEPPKQRKKSQGLVFRPKPRNIIILVAIAAAIVVAILLLTNVLGQGQYADSISEFKNVQGDTNGVPSTTYQPIVAEDVDWDNISASKREGIAKYAVKKVMDGNPTGIYVIMGLTHDNQPAFYCYQDDNRVQVFKGNAVENIVTLE